MNYHVCSIQGAGHSENQDHVLVFRHPIDSRLLIGLLADGQGGQPDAAQASRIACEAVWTLSQELSRDELLRPESWRSLLAQADRAVAEGCDGFTTLLGFALDGESLCGASVGDSRMYFLQAGTAMTELTSQQEKNPPVGSSACRPTPFGLLLERGSRFLAATDGVWKFVGYERLEDHLRNREGEDLAHALEREVLEGNRVLPDDFSLIWVLA